MDEVILGTYEGFILGYKVSCGFEGNKLEQSFAAHSHTSSVRCVDISGRYMASGGTDDKVVVIDMKLRKEHTVLMHHDGTINALAFTKNGTHLLTGSSDGSIVIIRTGNWQIEKKWRKAHGGSPVDCIVVHPSDKLALSIGGDKTLRTWNLVKGRPAFTINLSGKGVKLATELRFSPSGDRFSMISQQTVDIWTITKAGIEKRITCQSKPNCVSWISDEIIAVGLENGNIIIVTITDTHARTCHAHNQRVKCIYYTDHCLYSATSSGELKMWHLSDSNTLTEQCVALTGGRVTCITLSQPSIFMKKEEKEEKQEVDIKNISNEIKDDNTESNGEDKNDSEHDEHAEKFQGNLQRKKRQSAFVTVEFDKEEESQPATKKARRKKNKKKNFKKHGQQSP